MPQSRIFLAVVASLICAPPLGAQVRDTTKADTIFRIPGLSVQVTRPVTTVGGSSAVQLRIDSIALPAAPVLDQILREIPAVHVRRNSRGESEISVRGSDSRQVAVLVDGVPLTLGWDARADVSVVPATAPTSINFVRGLSSMLYGPNVLGGIVEVGVGQTDNLPQSATMQLVGGLDHTGGYASSATVTLPIASESGNWLMRGGMGYRDSPGLPLARGVREPVPADRDLRLNTDVTNVDGFVAMQYRADGGTWFSFSGSGFRAERGVAAELGVAEPRLWRYPNVSRVIAIASGGTGDRDTPFGGRGDLEASIGVDFGRTDIDAYESRDYSRIVGFEDGDDRTLTLRLLGDHTLGSRGDLRAAFTLADIHHDEFLPSGNATYRQRLASLGAETIWRLANWDGGSIRLTVGGALDAADTPETGGKPALGRLEDWGARVGLSASLNGGNTLLHAGGSRRGRFPALRELYSGSLNRFEPNPTLTPEHLTALEGGITTRIGAGELQAVVFYHDLTDAVVRVLQADGRFKRINQNRIRSAGLELIGSHQLGPLSLAMDLTAQSVDVDDAVAGTSNRPENLPELFGSLRAGFPIFFAVNGTAVARYTGDQFCIHPTTGEDQELAAGVNLGAEVGRTWQIRAQGSDWLSRLETRVGVDNVLDRAIYDQCGLPQPGRLVHFQVRLF
jgi:iron complex outermembrane receptor protein